VNAPCRAHKTKKATRRRVAFERTLFHEIAERFREFLPLFEHTKHILCT
jgi:hypothetical protein